MPIEVWEKKFVCDVKPDILLDSDNCLHQSSPRLRRVQMDKTGEYEFSFVIKCSEDAANRIFASIVTIVEAYGLELGGGFAPVVREDGDDQAEEREELSNAEAIQEGSS